jgi:hypothetical protein
MKKSQQLASFGFVVALMMFVGMFFVMNIPESHAVRSADGAVTVSGLTRESQQMSASVDASVAIGEPLLGMAYRIEPSGVALDAPVVLSFTRSADLGTLDATVVYQWNAVLGMWVPLSNVVADTAELLSVQVSTLGDFALGSVPTIDAPTLLTTRDTLLKKAPTGTRGFRIAESYKTPTGVSTQLPNADVIGGCGGRVGAAERQEYSSSSATVNVLVDDVQTEVNFSLVAEWAVSGDGTGCPVTAPLQIQQ